MELVRRIATKQADGTLSDDSVIGAIFSEVVDTGRTNATGYTLDQLMDSYMDFMKTYPFTYVGANKPTNSHAYIWVDTSVTNQDNL